MLRLFLFLTCLVISLEGWAQTDSTNLLDTQKEKVGIDEGLPWPPPSQAKQVYLVVDKLPEFPGGEKALRTFIKEEIRYPPEAAQNRLEGIVYISFVISEIGKVENIIVLRGIPGLSEEAVRIVKRLPDWKPGIKDGKNVSVRYNLPINFILNEQSTKSKWPK